MMMMLTAGLRIALGQNDLIVAFGAIDRSDVLAVSAEHFHVCLDVLNFAWPCGPPVTRGLTRAGSGWFL